MSYVDRLEALFVEHGSTSYEGLRWESVSALDHALQCAQLAEWSGASSSLIVAALLHDVGHFIEADRSASEFDDIDDAHEERALPLLREGFADAVVLPVRLHVEAKRYLVATDRSYAATLSPASVHSLARQGGSMTVGEIERFLARPFSRDAVNLRRWDDLAKERGRSTPSLSYFLTLVEDVHQANQATRSP